MVASFVAETRESGPAQRSRRRLLVAWLYDLGTFVLVLLAAGVVAALWLLARTEWGRLDVATGEAVLAASLLMAAAPAWAAWQWLRLWDDGRTAGHARLRLEGDMRVRGRRRIAALALHPVSLPAWGWLALTLIIVEVPLLPWLAVAVTAFVALLGALSCLALLVRPPAEPLHQRIAQARLR